MRVTNRVAYTLATFVLTMSGCAVQSDDLSGSTGDQEQSTEHTVFDHVESDAGVGSNTVPAEALPSEEEVSFVPDTLVADGETPAELSLEKAVVQGFTTMSINTRAEIDRGEYAWSVLRPRVTKMIKSYVSNGSAGPDLIGLQEVTPTIRDQLSADLPKYWWYYVNRNDNSGIAVFVNTARFEVVHYTFRDVQNSTRDGSCRLRDDEDPENRPIQRILLRDKQSGRSLYFFNTHYPSKHSCERHGMTNILSNYIAERPVQPSDVLLVGDLNDGIEADGRYNGSYSSLENQTGLRGSYAAKNQVGAATKYRSTNKKEICSGIFCYEIWDPAARSGRLIDHILFSSRARILSSSVDRTVFTTGGTAVPCATITNGKCPNGMTVSNLKCYSDHWAVVARIAGQ